MKVRSGDSNQLLAVTLSSEDATNYIEKPDQMIDTTQQSAKVGVALVVKS